MLVKNIQKRNKAFILFVKMVLQNSGEPIINGIVIHHNNNTNYASNEFGSTNITLNQGVNYISYIFPGLTTQTDTIIGDRNYRKKIILIPSNDSMSSIRINASQSVGFQISNKLAGLISISNSQLISQPKFLGESDILRSISTLPGIISGSEGILGLYVRGGNLDENLTLIDGVPIFNGFHLYGIFSSFNTDVIKNIDLLKGYFPPSLGGRASSVININTMDGNKYKLSGTAALGLLSSKINMNGPIFKDRTTFFVSLRRSYFDFLTASVAKRIPLSDTLKNNFFYFYDIHAKVSHAFNNKNKLILTYYNSYDKGGYIQKKETKDIKSKTNEERIEETKWGNTAFSLSYLSFLQRNYILDITAYQTSYKFNFTQSYNLKFDNLISSTIQKSSSQYEAQNAIKDQSIHIKLSKTNRWSNLVIGSGIINHSFQPGNRSLTSVINGSSAKVFFNDQPQTSQEFFQHAEWAQNYSRKVFLNFGFRNAFFANNNLYLYALQEVRASARVLISKNIFAQGSYSRNYQFFHLLNNFSLGLPSDIWVPSNKFIKPVQANSYSTGLVFSKNQFKITADAFFKQYGNLLEYKQNESYLTNSTNWENSVTSGTGNSYGAELYAQKLEGNLTGWISYTWLKSMRTFNELNNGNPFPTRYDRRHNISITGAYKLKKNMLLSASWSYSTGFAYTLPTGKLNAPTPQDPYREIFFYGLRNNERARSNHRLDIGLSLIKAHKKFKRTLSFGLFNAYNRHNPFFYQFYFDEKNERQLNSISLLPILPSINYEITF